MADEGEAGAGGGAPFARTWLRREPGRLIGKGHPAGDFLEAWRWTLLEERPGRLRVRAHLPEHVKNPRGEIFGGFTPTYVDLVALFTFRAGEIAEGRFRSWLATTSMSVQYSAARRVAPPRRDEELAGAGAGSDGEEQERERGEHGAELAARRREPPGSSAASRAGPPRHEGSGIHGAAAYAR